MYNEEVLLERVKGHLNDKDVTLLQSLIKDVDEFNAKYGNKIGEMYIDYDDVGSDGEYDPYETFSLRFYTYGNTLYIPVISSGMDIMELDIGLACIAGYFNELSDLEKRWDNLEEELKFYKNKCLTLEYKLRKSEEKNLNNFIIN